MMKKKCLLCGAILLSSAFLLTGCGKRAEAYDAAVELMNEGRYEEAIFAFEALEDYRDSQARITDCETAVLDAAYDEAVSLMGDARYEEALSAFAALDGYRDIEEQTARRETAIRESVYETASALEEAGRYEEAIAAFSSLEDYKDAGERIARNEALIAASKVNVGDSFFFGHFEQDNDETNGKEEIQWLVLEKEDNRIFVISKYALFAQGYNEVNTNVSWETCTLRACLNSTFLDEAFSAEEQAQIPTVTVPPAESPKYRTDPGNATEDKVFLISIRDLEKYFPTDSDRECMPTAYALANGAKAKEVNGNCWWWLRSPGIAQNCAARVNCYGSLRNSGPPVSSDYSCVRPAMWIDLVP